MKKSIKSITVLTIGLILLLFTSCSNELKGTIWRYKSGTSTLDATMCGLFFTTNKDCKLVTDSFSWGERETEETFGTYKLNKEIVTIMWENSEGETESLTISDDKKKLTLNDSNLKMVFWKSTASEIVIK